MKIWILCRKIYRKSYTAERFSAEAKKSGISLRFVHPEDFEMVTTGEGIKTSILHKGKVTKLPDILLPRMGYLTSIFALAVIREFEHSGVRVINRATAIEQAKDKFHSLQILASRKIPIPKTMLMKYPLSMDIVRQQFSFPLILKTVSGGKGKGVMLCEREEDLHDLSGILEKSRASVILQEFLEISRGRDVRVFIINGEIIGNMLRTAQSGFKANISTGGHGQSFDLPQEAAELALRSAKAIGLDIAGVDLLFSQKGFCLCEVNSAPGFRGFEEATGKNVPQEIFSRLEKMMKEPKTIS